MGRRRAGFDYSRPYFYRVTIKRREGYPAFGRVVGTFMSPCETACGHALGLSGGRWVVLSPEGFGDRCHQMGDIIAEGLKHAGV